MTFYNRNGMLYARVNGKRISTKLKDTKANRKLFESYAKNEEFFNKFNVNTKIPTLIELCKEVLRDKEKTLKPSSLRAYYSLYNSKVKPFFKDMLVTEIKPITIKNWYKTFTNTKTMTTCEAILKPAIEDAILSEYITSTPFVLRKPQLRTKYEINPFTLKEVEVILNNIEDIDFRNFLGISFFTGVRPGELIGLMWNDIDFRNNKISIKRTIIDGIIQEPKTKSSKATIDLPIEALQFFKSQRLKTGLRDYVFYSTKNKPYTTNISLNTKFKKNLKKLKLEYRTMYQTRHTFASLKLSAGERIEWVSFMMRHKSPSITQNKYYKYIPSLDTKRVILDINVTQNRHTS